MLSHFFALPQHNTSVRQEIIGGLTTFLTMAYIIIVNPSVLSEMAQKPSGLNPINYFNYFFAQQYESGGKLGALRFVCITSAFFLFGAFIYEPLKAFDKDINIYRYVVWAFNDIAWMALIAYLGLKDKVYFYKGDLMIVP